MSRANKPAFPFHVPGGSGLFGGAEGNGGWSQMPHTEGGVTIREHFAGLALQGLLANPPKDMSSPDPQFAQLCAHIVARKAVMCADAMIAELEKPRGT